jgi:adenosylcobinamide kinase/adenosylcobinamide-phosphate guanylyltransferase
LSLELATEFDKIANQENATIILSNEIGMGLHADTHRKFTELQGWMNQYIAKNQIQWYLWFQEFQ